MKETMHEKEGRGARRRVDNSGIPLETVLLRSQNKDKNFVPYGKIDTIVLDGVKIKELWNCSSLLKALTKKERRK